MKKGDILKTFCLALLGLILVVFLFIGVGKGIFYYNYNLAPPAKLMKKIKCGQPYQEVYLLFHQYQEKYKNDPDVSVVAGCTDQRTSEALKIPQGKYLHLYHWIFLDDLQLTVYFDKSDKVIRIYYVGD